MSSIDSGTGIPSRSYICQHVFRGERPVMRVLREHDCWQMLCDLEHGETEMPHVVHVHHLMNRDATLRPLLTLPVAAFVERSPSEPSGWVRAAYYDPNSDDPNRIIEPE